MKTIKITEQTHKYLTKFKKENCLPGTTYDEAIKYLFIKAYPENNYLIFDLLSRGKNNETK